RHAGRRRACRLGAFQQPHTLFEHRDGWIGKARIDEPGLVASEAGLGLLSGVVDVALGEKERLGCLAKLRPELSAVDEERFGRPLLTGIRNLIALRHGRLLTCWPQGKKKTRPQISQNHRARARFARGLLASSLTWLQAGRPNHHDALR